MGSLGAIGKGIAILALGALGGLAVIRVADDRYVDGLWHDLENEPAAGEVFSEAMVEGLPAPARRYFLHAIRPGTPIATRLRWSWSGELKPSDQLPWLRLTSEQISVRDRGYVWKASTGSGPLRLTAVDHYVGGEGRMRISLYGLVPVVTATGSDLSRSALGRLVAEAVFLPSALLPAPHVRIVEADDSCFTAMLDLQGEQVSITITVDQQGRVMESVMPRWGNLTEDGSYREIPYGGVVEAEQSFGGYTIPSRMRVGWWYGTERYLEVVRLQLESAAYE